MTKVREALTAVITALLDLAMPQACSGCSSPGHWLCFSCASALRGAGRQVWPSPEPSGLPQVFASAGYDSVVRNLVIAHKEHARLELATPLGNALAEAVRAALSAAVARDDPRAGAPVLVPVPSLRATVRARGQDPLLRMARVAGSVASLRRVGAQAPLCVAPVLRHRRQVADQAGLTATERAANLTGAIEVRPRRLAAVRGLQVVVVDDVLTTGATMVEVTRALREAGAHVLGAAVVAATVRRAG